MPWKETTTMLEKERFVQLATQPNANLSNLCREFGVSRETGRKLRDGYIKKGKAALIPQSRQPKTSPNKTPDAKEKLILSVRDRYPKWGPIKITKYLSKQGHSKMPSLKTVSAILKRHGRITIEESEKHKPFIRFEHPNPNDLWQIDFKGHFALNTTGRCHPLTLLDDHSRFLLTLRAFQNELSYTVKQALIDVFRKYGLPKRMTMDNGSPWGYSGDQQYTKLNAWLMRLEIKVSHSRPRHPQTQGKIERLHRTFKEELLSLYTFDHLEDAQYAFDEWRHVYNTIRPHGAIDLDVPDDRYKASSRLYPETLPSIEYDSGLLVRKVQSNGEIHFKGKTYRVGQAFHGYPVGLKEAKEDGFMEVYFCQQKVLLLDLNMPV